VTRKKSTWKLALNLARKGVGLTSPNPLVGAVIVKNGKIVGKGYHKYFGGEHAEVVAIKSAKGNTKGSTLYVNLEPCAHLNKKTPPCVPLIINSGIKRAVIAMIDPNPQVNGLGIKKLQEAGIECVVGVLEKDARELNKYYIKYITKKEPYVILKSAISLDGKIATYTGDSKWITSESARSIVYKLRSEVDAILVGINTIEVDDPLLTTHGYGKKEPYRVVVDPFFRISIKSQVVASAMKSSLKTIIISSTKYLNKYRRKFNFLSKKGIIVEGLGLKKNSRIDFREVVKVLSTKYNIASLLIEGGGTTNAYALEDRIVDELWLFVAPIIIGGKGAITFVEGSGVKKVKEAIKVHDIVTKNIGEELLLIGKIPNSS